jgi:hypothetical protein
MIDLVLQAITEFYLHSGDFNGIPLLTLQHRVGAGHLPHLKELVLSGHVGLVFGDVHPNPHIRALEREHSPAEQVELLDSGTAGAPCIYPLPLHLKTVVDAGDYSDRPYTLALRLGEAQLTYRSFDLAILETYRSDPRYHYDCDDIHGSLSVHDEFFEKGNMPGSDQILLQSFGFSYDDINNKYVAAFLRYLHDLSPEHQRLWQAREVAHKTFLHPDYFRTSILGDFPERVSIYEAFIVELQVINKMARAMGRSPLFRKDYEGEQRPREFSSLLRPTARQYADFVLLLDKLISDNMDTAFFRNDVPFEDEEQRNDGKTVVKPRGSIRILDAWLAARFRPQDDAPLREMIDTFRTIRRLRQRPAHAIDENSFNQTYLHEQRELMARAYTAVQTIRLIFANHPKCRTVDVPDWLSEGRIWPR